MDTSPMVYEDLAPIQVPVHIGKNKYVLHEATEGATCAYRNAQMRAAKFTAKGELQGVDGLADVEPLLISLCLCHTDDGVNAKRRDDGTLITVTLAFVRQLPPQLAKDLFKRIKDISPGMDEQPRTIADIDRAMGELAKERDALVSGESPTKNLQSATTSISE